MRGGRLITATRNNRDNINVQKAKLIRNAKKNNCMDISSGKQATSHTRKR